MAGTFQAIGAIIRQARRKRGLTQAALARKIESTQPQISAFESGRTDVLAKDKILKLASFLEVDLETVATPAPSSLRYCPNSACATNDPYVMGADIVIKPTFLPAESSRQMWCRVCGEVLERCCPDPACNAPITRGMFCGECGQRYVVLPPEIDGQDVQQLEAWAVTRRERNREVLSAKLMRIEAEAV